ncbi:MAG: hypothetical protein Q7K34_03480 [archaeon]|nr:hypothetical protein [archaeon]
MNFRTLGFLFLVAVILIFSVSFVAAARTSDGEGNGNGEPEKNKCMNCKTPPPVQPLPPTPGKLKCIYYLIFGGAQDNIERHTFRRDFICIAPEGNP